MAISAAAQNRSPLIPSLKNDRLMRESRQETEPAPQEDTSTTESAGTKETANAETPENTPLPELSDSATFANLSLQPLTTTEVEYVPSTGNYIIHTKMGGVDVEAPILMTPEEYARYAEQQQMHGYWQKKISEVDHDNEQKFDITDMKFNIGPADKVFGPGGVQLKMQGSAELLFGFKHQYVNNPSLTPRARNNNIFDFDEKIQASVQGKVGDKLDFKFNYNTEASFSMDQMNLKLAYQGNEDDIIQSIEAGNVTLDLPSTLIRGSQALFGVKTNLKFGKLKIQALVSQQNSEATTVNSKGGAQTTNYEINVRDYDDNRHFFLSYFFRDRYEEAMATLPYVSSGVQINKIEVWITNKKGTYDQARNILAFADLGERNGYTVFPNHIYGDWQNEPSQPDVPQNRANTLYSYLLNQVPGTRHIEDATRLLEGRVETGIDFEKIESARLLSSSEYTLNTALGYISLKSALQPDEVLAVAYEYTYGGQVYQVGEFSTDNTEELRAPNALYLKLLKTSGNSPVRKNAATWDLLMKNVYATGASSMSADNFEMNIYYRNDSVGTDMLFLNEGSDRVKGKLLLRVMNLDRLDKKHNVFADGRFDFVEGYTVNSSTGRIFFPVLEPFGSHLRKQIDGDNPQLYDPIADKYCFQELYDSTMVNATEETERNKFVLRGKYAGASSNEISLGAMNVPRGSVSVTAGGATLIENVDYTVDYAMGRVTILNQAIAESGTPIQVKLENQSTFSMQRKSLIGTHLEYEFNKDFSLGGTMMYMNERALTTKVTTGNEPLSNFIWGMNLNYKTELPWLNSAIEAIPWMKTGGPSTFSINAEFAQLVPGHTREVGKAGTSYIDDFEASTTTIDVHYPSYWFLASTPRDDSSPMRFANHDARLSDDIQYNSHRAMMAWYTVDPIFGYPQTNTPRYIRDNVDMMSDHRTRIVYEQEIYPDKEILANEDTRLAVLNVSYYPTERGPYNVDANQINSDGRMANPLDNWGGMMRRIDQTDFEKANVEYIEFWLMDPAKTNPNGYGVDLYLNLGDISEDILRDGKKSFENGLPTVEGDESKTVNTVWGRVPRTNSTVMAFSNDPGSRRLQDLGLNGLNDEQEYLFSYKEKRPYGDFVDALRNKVNPDTLRKWENDPFSPLKDPAGDNFHYYRGTDFDNQQTSILDRYKHFNGTQGNSPASEDQTESYATASTMTPDIEDINNDNTLSENEKYFQYHMRIDPAHMQVGSQYIVSMIESNVQLRNGKTEAVRWYQFKIPLRSENAKVVGGIRNFKSIRFMRLFMTGADQDTHLRFGSLGLVRGEWRNYNKPLYEPEHAASITTSSTMNVRAVNIEEDGKRSPINYVLPPGVSRQTDPGQAQLVAQNEQALSLQITNLSPHDARAIYRQTGYDMRQYKRLQLFVHAEQMKTEDPTLADGELTAFMRLGTDLKSNYYEYEIPLRLTPEGLYSSDNENDRHIVWPDANFFDFALSVLTDAKLARNRAHRAGNQGVGSNIPYVVYDDASGKPQNRITVLGNPTLGDVQYIMIGVRNRSAAVHSAEVWVNELRLSEFNEEGGVAATANAALSISDIAQLNVSGRLETAGYGAIESTVATRNLDNQYQIATSAALEAGRLFPEKANLQIPLYVSYSNQTVKPKYNPLDSDVKLDDALDTYSTKVERDSVKLMSYTVQEATSFSVTNLKVNYHSKKRDMFYDPANFSISASFNKQNQHTPEVEKDLTTDHKGSFQYSYNFNPQPWEPFKKVEKVNKVKFLKELNFYYLPQSWAFNTNMRRTFNSSRMRDLTAAGYSIRDMTTYSKDFTWDRNFDFKYNLTKNMKFTFQTAMNSTVDEGAFPREIIRDFGFTNDYYEAWKDTIQRSLAKWGSPYTYQQVFTAQYSVPFNRIPYLEAITANASYNANYNWARTTTTNSTDEKNSLGNTVSSVRTWQIDGGINFETLYQKSKYWKQMSQVYTGRSRNKTFKPKNYSETLHDLKKGVPVTVGHRLASDAILVTITDSAGHKLNIGYKLDGVNKIILTPRQDYAVAQVSVSTRNPNERSAAQVTGDMFAYLGTMVRKIQVTYRNTASITLPGFQPQAGFMGQQRTEVGYAPGYDFAFGFWSDDFVTKARDRGWLSKNQDVVQQATRAKTEDLDIKMNLEPLPGLKITLNSKRYQASTAAIIYSFEDMRETQTGSFNITQVAIGSAFARIGNQDDNFASEVFDRFLQNRNVMTARVQERYDGVTVPGKTISPVSPTSPDVLVPAFLSAYTGRDVNKISHNPFTWALLPNWSVTFDGLGKLPWMRDHFRSVNLTHAYTCKYAIGAYNGYSTWQPMGDGKDRTVGFTTDVTNPDRLNPSSAYDITTVTMSETFSPLIGLNMTMKNSLSIKGEYRKQRNLALNITSVQLTEGHTDEFVIGGGYTIKDLNFVTKNKEGRQKKVSNDLKLSVDLSYKNIKTFLRKIDEGIAQASSGNKVFTIKVAADYVLSQKINLQLYYDHEGTTPLISTSYPVKADNVGINIKFMLTR